MSNTKIALSFLDIAFNQRDPRRAFRLYVGPHYVQHNPQAPDGAEASAEFLERFVAVMPQLKLIIHRTIAQDDLVATHGQLTSGPDDEGTAIVDLLRIVDGKIVEHWDVAQAVPSRSMNHPSMF